MSPYAEPRLVTDLSQCISHHTMDLPGFAHGHGNWDLREPLGPHVDQLGALVAQRIEPNR